MSEPAVTTQSTAEYTPATAGSRFVWHDMMTTDLPRSLEFYTTLFGWERKPFDMGPAGTYDMLYAGEIGIGGMVPLAGEEAQGVPPHWIGYISVPDVDAACAKADAMGGKTRVPPTDIPNVGRFAVVEDSTGAVFSPFHSTTPEQPWPANAPVGTFGWDELMTTDAEKAAEFYVGLTGWTIAKMDMGEMGVYHMFKRGEENAGGMMQMGEDHPAPGSYWMPYVVVESVDASAARATELGATLVVPPTDIQDWGRFTIAIDPVGAAFGLYENKRPM
jgi:uncharacterized protein